ncbi:hypothetical protein BB561_003309 [Smittium simulii]|uniref:Centrosomin N-terminal motif 1 domain-containing protein n=1 Tax=Smittium simulii TaxID=133385 RepID=A0A2T9YM07_9FUNG|nr:hypothetical protein BB561_003309 [Smittium simulii]
MISSFPFKNKDENSQSFISKENSFSIDQHSKSDSESIASFEFEATPRLSESKISLHSSTSLQKFNNNIFSEAVSINNNILSQPTLKLPSYKSTKISNPSPNFLPPPNPSSKTHRVVSGMTSFSSNSYASTNLAPQKLDKNRPESSYSFGTNANPVPRRVNTHFRSSTFNDFAALENLSKVSKNNQTILEHSDSDVYKQYSHHNYYYQKSTEEGSKSAQHPQNPQPDTIDLNTSFKNMHINDNYKSSPNNAFYHEYNSLMSNDTSYKSVTPDRKLRQQPSNITDSPNIHLTRIRSKSKVSPSISQNSKFSNSPKSLKNKKIGFSDTTSNSFLNYKHQGYKASVRPTSCVDQTALSSNNFDVQHNHTLASKNQNYTYTSENKSISSNNSKFMLEPKLRQTSSKLDESSLKNEKDYRFDTSSVYYPPLKNPDDIKSQTAKIQKLMKEKFDLQIRNKTLMDSLNQLSSEGLDALVSDFSRARESNIRANQEITRLRDRISELKKHIKNLETEIKNSNKCMLQHGINQEERDYIKFIEDKIRYLEVELDHKITESQVNNDLIAELQTECNLQYKINEQLKVDAINERAKSDQWQSIAQNPRKLPHQMRAGTAKELNSVQSNIRNSSGLNTTSSETNETLFSNYEAVESPYLRKTHTRTNTRRSSETYPHESDIRLKQIEQRYLDLEKEHIDSVSHFKYEINQWQQKSNYHENENKLLLDKNNKLEQFSEQLQDEVKELSRQLAEKSETGYLLSKRKFEEAESQFLRVKITNLETELFEKKKKLAEMTDSFEDMYNSLKQSKREIDINLSKATASQILEHKLNTLINLVKSTNNTGHYPDNKPYSSIDNIKPSKIGHRRCYSFD